MVVVSRTKIAKFRCVHHGVKFTLFLFLVKSNEVGKYYEVVSDDIPINAFNNLKDTHPFRKLEDVFNAINWFDYCEEVIE